MRSVIMLSTALILALVESGHLKQELKILDSTNALVVVPGNPLNEMKTIPDIWGLKSKWKFSREHPFDVGISLKTGINKRFPLWRITLHLRFFSKQYISPEDNNFIVTVFGTGPTKKDEIGMVIASKIGLQAYSRKAIKVGEEWYLAKDTSTGFRIANPVRYSLEIHSFKLQLETINGIKKRIIKLQRISDEQSLFCFIYKNKISSNRLVKVQRNATLHILTSQEIP